ncbi:MAG: tetratricopeptide repeat protein [Flavobacteriaceae bacterium]
MKKFLVLFVLMAPLSWAQTTEPEVLNHIVEGNQKTQNNQLAAAEKDYRQALGLSPNRTEALYNLGNNQYQGSHYDEAAQQYFLTQKNSSDKAEKHQAFHNLGNVQMQKKDYAKAVEAYKNALRNNPADEETRYNYALAKELLEKEKQQQDQQNQDQNQQQNQDQDQEKEQEKDQENKGDQNQDQSDQKEGDDGEDKSDQGQPEEKDGEEPKSPKNDKQQPPKENKQPPKPQKGKLSPEQIKNLLEAMNNQEKKVQDKVNAEKVKGVPVKGKKDW